MIKKAISNSDLSDKQIESFQRKGFLLLKNVFSDEFIQYIKRKIDDDIAKPSDKYQSGFNRIAFDLFNKDPVLSQLMLSKDFRDMMKKLTKRTLLYTQSLGFELAKNESKGFPWHIGTQSFGYQRAEDFGCTIWTPLVKIDNTRQQGGMAYVPKDKVSGEFLYKDIDPTVFDLVTDKINKNEQISIEEFVHLRDGPLNDPAMKNILDKSAEQDDFELGDALIFDKNVIHRSVFLSDGPIDSRAAFVMRFVCSNSRYDKERADNLEIPRKHFNYKGPTRFHLEVCHEDNMPIIESELLSKDLSMRTLR